MATVMDVGLLHAFDVIFPVLFVFALLFALLQKTKVIGSSPAVNGLISIAVAFMMLLSEELLEMINFMIPWFVILIVFFVLMMLVFQTFGAGESFFANALKDKVFIWVLIGLGILIFIVAFGTVIGPTVSTTEQNGNVTVSEGGAGTSSDFGQNVLDILFHPKVLGLIVIFLVAIFAVFFLSG